MILKDFSKEIYVPSRLLDDDKKSLLLIELYYKEDASFTSKSDLIQPKLKALCAFLKSGKVVYFLYMKFFQKLNTCSVKNCDSSFF